MLATAAGALVAVAIIEAIEEAAEPGTLAIMELKVALLAIMTLEALVGRTVAMTLEAEANAETLALAAIRALEAEASCAESEETDAAIAELMLALTLGVTVTVAVVVTVAFREAKASE